MSVACVLEFRLRSMIRSLNQLSNLSILRGLGTVKTSNGVSGEQNRSASFRVLPFVDILGLRTVKTASRSPG